MKRGFAIVLAAALAAPALIAQSGQSRLAPAPAERLDTALVSLVEAERAFARLSRKVGQLPAFLAYFADDVVTFQPLPVTGKDGLREKALAASYPSPRHLDWEPWFADVAASGDLGYTTGPTLVSDAATGKILGAGWYFSIWKRDANGWRVAADTGVEAPGVGPIRPQPLTAGVSSRNFAKAGSRIDDVLALERETAERVSTTGTAGYDRCLGPAARLYRDGVGPVVGDAIPSFLASRPAPAGWRPLGGAVAASGDLAYTYGLYDVPAGQAGTAARASFLHVWKPAPTGWSLAAEVVTGGR